MAATSSPMSALMLHSDDACAHDDFASLAHDAELLACCVAEPLRNELLDVVRRCRDDRAHAAARWHEVRAHLRHELETVDPALHASA